jgi:hypothetical protein
MPIMPNAKRLGSSAVAALVFLVAASLSAYVTRSPARTWDGPPS